MAGRGIGNTAIGAATCRLVEQFEPEASRLFDDPIVSGLVGGMIRTLMCCAGMRRLTVQQTDAMLPGLYGGQICRTRYIDDTVEDAVARGVDQVVLLGAGLDTRPYRLACLRGTRVFELDLEAVQARKRAALRRRLRGLPGNVRFLSIDFDAEDLGTALAKSDFDQARRAVFVWEGVTQYITEAAVRRTLAFVRACPTGSVLVFTYVLKSVVERRSDVPGAGKLMDYLSAKNRAPWLFGLEPEEVPALLAAFGLQMVEDVGAAVYEVRYLKPRGRALPVTAAEHSVQAVRA